jgi:hypothetical protein
VLYIFPIVLYRLIFWGVGEGEGVAGIGL